MDLILTNGRIWTGSIESDGEGSPREAAALAVRDGRILAIGSDDEIAPLAESGTRVIDLRGRRAIPGLIDSHMHLVRGGVSWAVSLHWEELTSVEEALAQVRERAAATPEGTWISVVGGWHRRQFVEGRAPTRAELDDVAPNHPVYLQQLYDTGTLNSRGLELCGWDDSSPNPERGALLRDADGRLTGEIEGQGAFRVPIRLALVADHETQVRGTEQMQRDFAAHGLTGANDGGGMLIVPADYRAMYDVWRAGNMSLRVRVFYSAWTRGGEIADVDAVTAISGQDFGDGLLKVVGIGEIPQISCHDLEGLTPFELQDAAFAELQQILSQCADRGWRVSMHAVRNATLSRVLDVWEAVDGGTGRLGAAHWSIVHAEEATRENLDRIAALGVGIQLQNRMYLKAQDYLDKWGAEAELEHFPPLGWIRDRGIPYAAGTDATRANWYLPWSSIEWFVTGENILGAPGRAEEHLLSVEEALLAYTRHGAWFTSEEGHRGRLAVGYDADICVPTADPFDVDPHALHEIRSDLTLLGGKVTHAAGDFAREG